MALSIGIVGLPNVGKSTVFNALTEAQSAEAANYPFCTIEPNHAIVPVPDPRLQKLTEMVEPAKTVHATVEFVDIAGLVRGASTGEGLGNKFLGNIRETSAILHVVRCFEDDDVTHVDGSVDPVRDVDVIETELIFADVQTLETHRERLVRQVKGDPTAKPLLAEAETLLAHLNSGQPAFLYAGTNAEATAEISKDLISAKDVIYCANVDEGGLEEDSPLTAALRDLAESRQRRLVKISAKVEEEMIGLGAEERAEFLSSYGVTESGIEQVIRAGYSALGLISYFTAGPKEVKAWTIRDGWSAPQAAGVIHTDFEKGFIRAETIAYDDYVARGGESGCRDAGLLKIEGKEYIVRDGDILHFRFNV